MSLVSSRRRPFAARAIWPRAGEESHRHDSSGAYTARAHNYVMCVHACLHACMHVRLQSWHERQLCSLYCDLFLDVIVADRRQVTIAN